MLVIWSLKGSPYSRKIVPDVSGVKIRIDTLVDMDLIAILDKGERKLWSKLIIMVKV